MGMYDYVRSEIALPDEWEGELQSKDFDCEMTTVLIRVDGRLLIERFDYETVPLEERPYPDPDSVMRFAGSMRKINRRWDDLNFHGDFGFGALEDLKDDYWVDVPKRSDGGFWQKRYRDHDYTARFSNGQLDWIRDDNAQGIEARSGETQRGSTAGNSPVGPADAPEPNPAIAVSDTPAARKGNV